MDHRDTALPNRRELLQLAGLFALGLPLNRWVQPVYSAEQSYLPLNHFPRMVQEFFVRQVRQAEQRGREERAALKTRADAEAYVERVRQRIRQSFGPEPPRTALNARVVGVVERDAYRIEKIILESRPNFPVTANLYIPSGRAVPMPAVVGTCGHSANGKAQDAYQSFAQGLARLGFICFIFDPIGQGERLQYVRENLTSRIGVGVQEHLYAGNQQFLVGEFFGAWRAWDGIRALDYLLTRPEVDKTRVGVTGNSGGGTMTTWLCGLDQRWAMGAPSCFVTTFRRNLENELPVDTEQCPPKALALGLDHADFLAALAPKPVIILGKERDYFDVRGVEEAYSRLQHIYRLLGAEENVGVFVGPTTHGFTIENREAMYGWFLRAAQVGDPVPEPELKLEKDETLWCTPRGQVAEQGAKTVFQFTREKSLELAGRRGQREGTVLLQAVQDVLKLPASDRPVPDYRILRYLRSRKYPAPQATAYAVETEPDVFAIVYRLSKETLLSRPPRSSRRALLYVAHLSSDVELREEPLLRELIEAERDVPVFTCDVRGIGESQPDTCGPNSFRTPYGSDFFYAIHSLMLDRPYLGQKTHDVLRVLQWLAAYGHEEVHLAGLGWGALPATFAALLSDQVVKVTLKNALTSYSAIAESEDYNWPLATLLPDVLARFDLPDCYRALEQKALRLIDPWDENAAVKT